MIISTRQLIVPLNALATKRGVSLLSKEMAKHLRASGERISSLARRANLGTATASRILARETIEPRLTTVLALFSALGYSAMKLED